MFATVARSNFQLLSVFYLGGNVTLVEWELAMLVESASCVDAWGLK